MIILNIPQETEDKIRHAADKMCITMEDLLIASVFEKIDRMNGNQSDGLTSAVKSNHGSLYDLITAMPAVSHSGYHDIDAVSLQQHMRDEWS